MSFAEMHFEAAAEADAEAEAESPAKTHKFVAPAAPYPTTKLTAKPRIVKAGKPKFFSKGHRLPQFEKSKVETADVQRTNSVRYQVAAVHAPEFFKPLDRKNPASVQAYADAARFVETVIAADQPELSAVPTEQSLPALQLEDASAEAVAETDAKALYGEVKSLIGAQRF